MWSVRPTTLGLLLVSMAVPALAAEMPPNGMGYHWRDWSSGCPLVHDEHELPNTLDFNDGMGGLRNWLGPIELGFEMPYHDELVDQVWLHRDGQLFFEEPPNQRLGNGEISILPPHHRLAFYSTLLTPGAVSWGRPTPSLFKLSVNALTSDPPTRMIVEVYLHASGDIRFEYLSPIRHDVLPGIGIVSPDGLDIYAFMSKGLESGPNPLATGPPYSVCFEKTLLPGESCEIADRLTPGSVSDDLATATASVEHHRCSATSWPGPERLWALEVEAPSRLRASLDSASEMTLFLLEDCRESSCLAAGTLLDVPVLMPGTWYLVVESTAGGTYDLDLELEPLHQPLRCGEAVVVDLRGATPGLPEHACAPVPLDDGERFYQVEHSIPGRLELSLDDGDSSRWILLHGPGGRGEDGTGCLAGGPGRVVLHDAPPGLYTAVIDGDGSGAEEVVLELACGVASSCADARPAVPGSVLTGDTSTGRAGVDTLSCHDDRLEGRELVFRIFNPAEQVLDLRFVTSEPGQRMHLLLDCDEGHCIDADEEALSLGPLPAGEYLLVVDGPVGSEGPFEIDLQGSVSDAPGIDLRATGLHLSDSDDCRSLVLDAAEVVVTNLGTSPVTTPFEVVVFRDAAGGSSATLDPGDIVHGRLTVDSLGGGETRVLEIVLTGQRDYRDQPVHAVVDPDGVVSADLVDSDDTWTDPPPCEVTPPASFELVTEWEWTEGTVAQAALVGDIDADGIPEVAFVYDQRVQVLDGRTGELEWRQTEGPEASLDTTMALVDLDGDPGLELVTMTREGGRGLVALDDDGSWLWTTPTEESPSLIGITVGDVDADGQPELFVNESIYALDGSLLTPGLRRWNGKVPAIGDLDLDGELELATCFKGVDYEDWTARRIWSRGRPNWENSAFAVLANLDGDPYPEVICNGTGGLTETPGNEIQALDGETGELLWQSQGARGGCGVGGISHRAYSAFLVADVDGDLLPETAVTNSTFLTVFEHDGSFKWARPIDDCSTGDLGPVGFDFDGDGAVEIVQRDEKDLFIFDGRTGDVLVRYPCTSGTLVDWPTVADVDADGRAEILLPLSHCGEWSPRCLAEREQVRGLRVLGTPEGGWLPTNTFWHEHAHRRSNVDDEGRVRPGGEGRSWREHGTWRAQPSTGGMPAPDLSLVLLNAGLRYGPDCAVELQLVVRIGNASSVSAPGPNRMTVRAGGPDGSVLHEELVPTLEADEWLQLTLSLDAIEGSTEYWVRLEADEAVQCRVDNDACSVRLDASPGSVDLPVPTPVGPALRARDRGDVEAAIIEATYDWSLDAGLPRPPEDHYVLRRGIVPWDLDEVITPPGHVETSWRDGTPRPSRRPFVYFYRVVAANDCVDETGVRSP
ncbi:MAG: VCBS repeat-containing protein [Acidobacteriota bacterium]